MGLLDIHADSIERSAMSAAARPGPAPDPEFSLLAMGASIPGASVAGLLEQGASMRDFLSIADQQVKKRPRPVVLRDQPASVMDGLTNGRALRKRADEFMPDPLTAHTATQVVAGFSKTLTKAGTAVVAAGPVGGAAIFGVGEANDTAQRLQEKGVDAGTAWQVGGVVGATSTLGVLLPVTGMTMAATTAGKVAATAGLAAVGGPLSFMAQEGLAREILQRGGYDKEAALRDPLNPIGLAASMFPFVLGGAMLRGQIKAGALRSEASLKAAVELSPDEAARSAAFERSAGNLAELKATIAAEKRPEARALLQSELDVQMKAAAGEVRGTAADQAARVPEAVDAARVAVVDEHLARVLPDAPGAHAEMLKAADMVGAGERVDVAPMIAPAERAANFKAWFGESKVVDEQGAPLVVYHGTTADFSTFSRDSKSNFSYGDQRGSGGFFFETSADRVNYYLDGPQGVEPEARVMPVYLTIKNPASLPVFRRLEDQAKALKEAEAAGHDGAVIGGTEWVAFKPEQIKSATGNSGRFDPMSANLTDPMPMPSRTAAPDAPAARQEAAPGSTMATAAEADSAAVKAAGESSTSTKATAIKNMAEQNPNMQVRLPGDESNTTLAAALERIKAEQALDATESDLYRAAIECALTAGASTP